MLILGVSGWQLLRGRHRALFSRSARLVLPITCAAALITAGFGHGQALLMDKQQPMKMAAAEALYNTQPGASFSIFAVGPFSRHPRRLNTDVRIPHGLSILSTLSWNGTVQGINQVNAAEQKQYGPGDYVPVVGVTYWSFRLMVGAGMVMIALTLAGLWLMRKRDRLERTRWFHRAAIAGVFLPIIGNWTGWIFTEIGRQPWIVYGLLRTNDGRSPNVSTTEIILSLTGYIVVYGVLVIVGARLMLREIGKGPEPPQSPAPPAGPASGDPNSEPHPDLVLAY
jgi:cytochrome d ubiquinol oxidase subunit I